MDSPSLNTNNNSTADNSVSPSDSHALAEVAAQKPRTAQSQKILKLRVSGSQRVICLSSWGLGNVGSQRK